MHLKLCISVYAYAMVSMYVSIHMPILWFARILVSKYIYMVLKNAPIFMPLSGSLRMLLDICLYMSFQRCLYYTLQEWPFQYTYICMSNDASLCMSMLGSLYMLLYMPILWFSSIPTPNSPYVILKNTPLCIPVSFSVVLLLNIYLY